MEEKNIDVLLNEATRLPELAEEETYRPKEDVASFLICHNSRQALINAMSYYLIKNDIQLNDWNGKVRLFYGAKSGLELLYLNDQDGDLTNYYDEETFKAFSAISPRPHWSDPIRLDEVIEERANEILEMLNFSNTRIYIAGYAQVKENLDKAFSKILGSKEKWNTKKAELIAEKKWAEVIY